MKYHEVVTKKKGYNRLIREKALPIEIKSLKKSLKKLLKKSLKKSLLKIKRQYLDRQNHWIFSAVVNYGVVILGII